VARVVRAVSAGTERPVPPVRELHARRSSIRSTSPTAPIQARAAGRPVVAPTSTRYLLSGCRISVVRAPGSFAGIGGNDGRPEFVDVLDTPKCNSGITKTRSRDYLETGCELTNLVFGHVA